MYTQHGGGIFLQDSRNIQVEPDKFNVQGFMVRAIYTNPPDESVIEKAQCPRKCLLTPEQHLQAVRDGIKKKEGAA